MICKVAYCPTMSLASLVKLGKGKCRVDESVAWIEVEIAPYARLDVTEVTEGKEKLKNAILKFRVASDLNFSGTIAFKVTTADGQQMIIGTNERPFCQITSSKVHPDNHSESQLKEYTVTLKGKEAVLYLI